MRIFKKQTKENQQARVRVFISGRVQGVFFRESAKKQANKLGIFGWIKNLRDGRVEAVFEGKKEKVDKILKWVKQGPLLAKVEKTDIFFENYQKEFDSFEIRYDIL